ncbi:MAG: efflux RND transporter periplasmic adaptor subunit [Sulfitobacter sp.]
MRIFSILAAALVLVLLYFVIIDRDALRGAGGSQAALPEAPAAPTPDQTGGKLVKVVVMHSRAQQVDSAVVLRGQTAAARQVDMRAETSATVKSEPLRKGAFVEAGETLCQLDPGTRGAALTEAEARLTEAQSRVPEAQARVAEAQALLEEAEINQNASARLSEGGFASTTRVANADATVASAQAGVSSARAGLRAARAGIEAAQAAVASTRMEIDHLTITAPFSGLLETDTAELGSFLQPGGLCATIMQLDPVKLVGFVPETEVNHVAVGAMAEARLAAGGDALHGRVSFLSRSADLATRTFRVEIDVPNPDLTIGDGQTAEILIAADGAQAHLVPQSSLTLNDEGVLGLRIVDENDLVVFAPIALLRDTPQGMWVTGLPQAADVIVRGQEYVVAGVKVAPTLQEVSQ